MDTFVILDVYHNNLDFIAFRNLPYNMFSVNLLLHSFIVYKIHINMFYLKIKLVFVFYDRK